MNRLRRRQFLSSFVAGSLLMPGIVQSLLADDAAKPASDDPLAPRAPHFAPKAKRVIFLFMTGGVSMLRVSEFLESVPNAKFEKPFDIAELRRTLHALVATSRGHSPSSPPQPHA